MRPANLLAIETRLRSDFGTLAERLGAHEKTTRKWSDELILRYTEPQRHYHTIEHIHSMLLCRDLYCRGKGDEMIIELSIFFHDWIYDPKGKDNELESIKCFEEFATEIKLSDSMVARVSEYIERTITHTLPIDPGEADSDLQLFLDFDLAVLSRSKAEYSIYAAQIRQEYSHFTEAEYCAGRIKVLKTFLSREHLYFSDAFHEMYEKTARANLEGEIEILEKLLKDLVRTA